MRILFFLFFAMVTILNTETPHAYWGDSNLFSSYPDHNCRKPHIPYQIESYEVESLKYEIERYRTCVKNYIESAENDRNRILEKENDLIREFNNFINSVR